MPDQKTKHSTAIAQTRGAHLYGDECFIIEFDQVVAQVAAYKHGDVVSYRVDPASRVVVYYLNGTAVWRSPRLHTTGEGVEHARNRFKREDDAFFDNATEIDLS